MVGPGHAFAFAKSGVFLEEIIPRMLHDPVTPSLFVGEQIGAFGLVIATVRLGLAQRLALATRTSVDGASLLGGAGFTMSLFIGLMAFANAQELAAETKRCAGRRRSRRHCGRHNTGGKLVLFPAKPRSCSPTMARFTDPTGDGWTPKTSKRCGLRRDCFAVTPSSGLR